MEMKEHWENSIDYYILPNKILCSIIGLWPIHKNSSSSNRAFAYLRLVITLTAASSVFVPEITVIAVNWGDLKVLTEVGCVSATVGQLIFKIIYLSARRERMCRLYYEMRRLWYSTTFAKERQTLQTLSYWARVCTIAFCVSGICNVLTFTIAGLVDYVKISYNVSNGSTESRQLPFKVWYGTDITESPKFEIAFLFQFLASLFCCAGICGLDTTFMTLILHACSQFKLNKMWFRDIGATLSYQSVCTSTLKSLNMEVNRFIRHHQRIIKNSAAVSVIVILFLFSVAKEINDLLSPILFVQLLMSGIEICLSGYAMLDGTSGTDLIKFVSYLSSMLIQLLLWCWPAELLIRESQDLSNVVYFDIPWYDLPPLYRRKFCVIILRAQHHCNITAPTFQTLSIRTLTNVFNTAGSYFTLLRQMQQN